MIPNQQTDTELTFLITIIAIFFAIVLIIYFAASYTRYSRELKYIKTEIRRSSGEEQQYWIKKKRELLLSFLSFGRL